MACVGDNGSWRAPPQLHRLHKKLREGNFGPLDRGGRLTKSFAKSIESAQRAHLTGSRARKRNSIR
jgi:hypothetical protein